MNYSTLRLERPLLSYRTNSSPNLGRHKPDPVITETGFLQLPTGASGSEGKAMRTSRDAVWDRKCCVTV